MTLSHSIFKNCTLCPRNCGVDRAAGKVGFCGEAASIRAARAALHMWEEPCISGKEGSGTVFFSGCNLGCVFCQNEPISTSVVGKEVSPERLTDIYLSLESQGANNINLVTPSHFVPQIIRSLELAKQKGLKLPIVYNTGSYEKVETLRMLDGLVDIYLPDLKFFRAKISESYCHAADYFDVSTKAIAEMYRQVGPNQFRKTPGIKDVNSATKTAHTKEEEESDIMIKGLLVRHLLLPGLEDDAFQIIKYLYNTYKNNIYLSIMSQYTPMPQVSDIPELSQPVNYAVYDNLLDRCIDLGVENAFIQEEGVAKESFIPLFDYQGL